MQTICSRRPRRHLPQCLAANKRLVRTARKERQTHFPPPRLVRKKKEELEQRHMFKTGAIKINVNASSALLLLIRKINRRQEIKCGSFTLLSTFHWLWLVSCVCMCCIVSKWAASWSSTNPHVNDIHGWGREVWWGWMDGWMWQLCSTWNNLLTWHGKPKIVLRRRVRRLEFLSKERHDWRQPSR